MDPTPSWWHPSAPTPPTEWSRRFAQLTEDHRAARDGRKAAYFVAKVRNQSGCGPTFSEMFRELFDDEELHPAWPAEMNSTTRSTIRLLFRRHVAIQWGRAGWISWEPGVPRSLKPGRAFHQRVAERKARKSVR